MIHGSFMSRANSIVIPGGKLDLAMQLILTPLILQLVETQPARWLRPRRQPDANHPRARSPRRPSPTLMANAIRALAMDAVEKAKSGHPGMPMGMADVATVLWTRFLKFDAARPRLAGPRPLRALGRPRLDAALRAAAPDRLSGVTIERAQALPPARLEDARPPRVRPHAGRRDDDRPARAGPRHRRRHGDRRAHAARRASAPTLVDHRTYVHRRRRLPDGGHQPRGGLARRPSRPRPADRPLRRQRHLDRRADLRSPARTTSSRRFAADGWHARARRRARPRRGRRRHRGRARRRGRGRRSSPAAPSSAAARRTSRAPRARTARRWAPPRSPAARDELGWPYPPFVDPGRGAAPPGAPSARAAAPRRAAWRERVAALPAAERAEFERRLAGRAAGRLARRGSRRTGVSCAETRPTVATRKATEAALEVADRGRAGAARRLGRPHPLEQHGHRSTRRRSRRGDFERALHPLRHPRARRWPRR